MTKAMLRKKMLSLPLKDRLDLVKDFDRALMEIDQAMHVPASHLRHIEEVIAEYKKHPLALVSRDEMSQYLEQLKQRLAAKRAARPRETSHLSPHVKFQIEDAAEWYETQTPQLGVQLVDEINQVLEKITQHPRQYPVVHASHRVRRDLLKKFPFAIYFIEKSDHLRVISIVHGSRAPWNWKRFLR